MSAFVLNNDFLLNNVVSPPVNISGNLATPSRVISPCDQRKEEVRKIYQYYSIRPQYNPNVNL